MFLKYTSEVIKQEFNRFKILENYEDEVWTIHCDKMKNYKDYFPESNPCSVEERYSLDERKMSEFQNSESNRFILAKSASLASFHRATTAKISSRTFCKNRSQ